MRLRVLIILPCAFCILHWALPAHAQPDQPIVEVQLDQEGRAIDDPTVLRLVETRVGDPLSVRSARETIAHLMSLGRYEDVQVFSEPVAGGVRVKYTLLPLHPVDRFQFTGTIALPEDELRRVITDRFGAAPSAARRNEVSEALRLEYRRRGYPSATVTPRVTAARTPSSGSSGATVQSEPNVTVTPASSRARKA